MTMQDCLTNAVTVTSSPAHTGFLFGQEEETGSGKVFQRPAGFPQGTARFPPL